VNSSIVVGGAGFTFYSYPELRRDPAQLWHAMTRGLAMITTGSLMAKDYKQAGENITSEVHYKAANRMFKTFCANGGPYIKLGQMFGQLQNLVPDEYCEVFEPMCMKAPKTKFDDVRSILKSELG
jgi:aarF domain-containing kinase